MLSLIDHEIEPKTLQRIRAHMTATPFVHPATDEPLDAAWWNLVFADHIANVFGKMEDDWRVMRRALRLMLPKVLEIHAWPHERKCKEQPGDIMIEFQEMQLDVLTLERDIEAMEPLYLTALCGDLATVAVDEDGRLVAYPEPDERCYGYWQDFLESSSCLALIWELWCEAMPKGEGDV